MFVLNYKIREQHLLAEVTVNHRWLDLHAKNCVVEDKTWFIVGCSLWHCGVTFEDEIAFWYLVLGHTKMHGDSESGFLNGSLKHFYVLGVREMVTVLDESSTYDKIVKGTEITWLDWKSLPKQFFNLLITLMLSTLHIFCFTWERAKRVLPNRLSPEASWEVQKLRKVRVGMSAPRPNT